MERCTGCRYYSHGIGVNPGNNFYDWMAGILKKNGIETVADLEKKFETVPNGLKIRGCIDRGIGGLKPRFTVIAADFTTETKADFPRLAPLYWKDGKNVNPAVFVRASMSVSFFLAC